MQRTILTLWLPLWSVQLFLGLTHELSEFFVSRRDSELWMNFNQLPIASSDEHAQTTGLKRKNNCHSDSSQRPSMLRVALSCKNHSPGKTLKQHIPGNSFTGYSARPSITGCSLLCLEATLARPTGSGELYQGAHPKQNTTPSRPHIRGQLSADPYKRASTLYKSAGRKTTIVQMPVLIALSLLHLLLMLQHRTKILLYLS